MAAARSCTILPGGIPLRKLRDEAAAVDMARSVMFARVWNFFLVGCLELTLDIRLFLHPSAPI